MTHARVTVGLPMSVRLNEAGLRSHHHLIIVIIFNATVCTNIVIRMGDNIIIANVSITNILFQIGAVAFHHSKSYPNHQYCHHWYRYYQYPNHQNHQRCHHKFDFRSGQWLGGLNVAMRFLFFKIFAFSIPASLSNKSRFLIFQISVIPSIIIK